MGYKNIFLTGEVKVGKSTALNHFLNIHVPKSCTISGFKTKPFYENDFLKGYYMESQISPIIIEQFENVVGRNTNLGNRKFCYGITETFDTKGVEILQESLKLSDSIILMDELGFFEKDAFQFKEQIHRCLDSPHKVLGILKLKKNDFLNSIVSREDVKEIRVTLENRNDMINEIYKYWE